MTGNSASAAPERKVGLIGFGAIGRSVAQILLSEPGYRLGIMTRTSDIGGNAGDRAEQIDSIAGLVDWQPDIVVEAASAQAFAHYVPACLTAGIDVVAASVGALQDADLMARILPICDEKDSHLIVPAGAVGGLDHIAAAALHAETHVTYTSRKPPAAWTSEIASLGLSEAVTQGAVTLYEGDAREAARRYPKNLNAGLTIALSAGFERTRVRVVADPEVDQNTHEILIHGPLGESFMRFRNTPDPANPKTSAITAFSLAAATMRRFGALQ